MKFDWYSATIPVDPYVILTTLSNTLQTEVKTCRPMFGYSQGFELQHPDRGVVARLLCGGNRDAYPNAWASGQDTEQFVEVVRDKFPMHLVTRFDSCEDFADTGVFDNLRSILRQVAVGHRLKFPSIEDTLNPGEGRTQYIGSRKSPQFARLYEKGKQLSSSLHGSVAAAATVVDLSTGEIKPPEEWTRLELVVRPQGEGRTIASTATPDQAWGFTSWSHELANLVFSLDEARVFIRQRRISKDAQAFRWMSKQYGAMLEREAFRLGGYQNLGNAIEAELEIIRKDARAKYR